LVGLNKFISQPAAAWAGLLLQIKKLMSAPGKKKLEYIKNIAFICLHGQGSLSKIPELTCGKLIRHFCKARLLWM
jgi:hypothetical protein